ncbi:MAG TPA: adenosylhomocysteinase [Syntrophothermus lipocalidus]|uniref:Adenosylhomocysteinase n=1 Tax=Syntrophothermus lipocalidus (strain DSM 12680 / TGB-C1) TaxID=643648 RepID=D7CMR6_SYNLT|nr:adenosylhomocysteinase [Syntrophothermus lipocalidus]ADI02001.1 adenosylhomocysteinase [Syntrophothermus lipocalidus DSM 12680]HHV76691.1 adenosylhomocysteinase [Syntrophothermus lipocalidus]
MKLTAVDQTSRPSMIRDITLAPSGHRKIEWASRHMPVLNILKTEFEKDQPLAGKRIAMCLHLEAKTAYLALTLRAAGAEVVVCASNPLSTQDDVVAALVEKGVTAFAWHGATPEEYDMHIAKALDCEPDALIDDGGDLVGMLHRERPAQARKIIGGCEETTTGILRLKAMEREGSLLFPMMAVNDAFMKYLFDNRYGTGQSVWDGIMRTTNLVVAGKTVVVAGYGWCGKGVSMRAKGLGARVIVTEIDPIKANEALLDGFEVMPMQQAAIEGDVFITVTGNVNVIRREHMAVMKDNAILANAGHFDVEVSKPDLEASAVSRRTLKNNIEEYLLPDGRRLYLLAEGRLVNLAAGDGHPAEVMDLSFSLQALSLLYMLDNQERLLPRVYNVPEEIDRKVAELRLRSLGVEIDRLTQEQERYLASWQL